MSPRFFIMATIGFTYDIKSDLPVLPGDPDDLNAEFDAPETIDRIAEAITQARHRVVRIGNLGRLLERLPKLDVDMVLNICEGIGLRTREAQVPMLLEAFKIPYVGSDGLTMSLALDKVMTKKILQAEGIPTPRFAAVHSTNDCAALEHLKFPLIVKLRYEGCSKGLSENSVVHTTAELRNQAEYLLNRYNNAPLIVEELIVGSEFTVPIIGNETPIVLPSTQVLMNKKTDLGEKIYTFASIVDPALNYVSPAQIAPELEKKIQDISLRTYRALECLDFGRVDVRVDRQGNPYVLEINPLPSLSDEDAYFYSSVAAGYSYEWAIAEIINTGLRRYGLLSRENAKIATRRSNEVQTYGR